jgi:arylsulfatase A-like enzyme
MKLPNILWICADQQRFDTLGCTGNGFVQTPHLDGLAASGTLFERCYSQSPVCTPSRASFLTGRYPRTTRCRQNGQSIPTDEVLVTRLLADAGYTCGLAGKLHLSACHPAACPAMERRINDGYHEFHWSHHPSPDWPTDDYNHWLRERGARFERRAFRGSKHVQVSVPAELHQTTWCVEKAIRFIEGNATAKAQRPWLFSINFFDPHHPFDPPEEYLQRYLDRVDAIPLPNYIAGELEKKPLFQRIDHEGAYGRRAGFAYDAMTPADHRLVRAAYWAMVDLIDAQVGRLLAALEATGQRDDTLVIFMSDHGEMLGDHGIYLKGPYFYEPAVHVPLLLALPRSATGEQQPVPRSRALVELVDLAPTLLDAAGLPRHPGMQGRSLWPLLRGEAAPETHRTDIYCEYYNATPVHANPQGHATMVRTDHHKLVVVHGVEPDPVCGELYDLEQDPGETCNRWDDPALLPTRCDLLRRLCDRMAWTVDPLPEREGPF